MKKILFSIFAINIILSFFFIVNIKSNEISKSISDLGSENSFTITIKQEIDNSNKKEAITFFMYFDALFWSL